MSEENHSQASMASSSTSSSTSLSEQSASASSTEALPPQKLAAAFSRRAPPVHPHSSLQKESAPVHAASTGFAVPTGDSLQNRRTRTGNRYQYRGPRGAPRTNNSAAVQLTDAVLPSIASILMRLDKLPSNITTQEIHSSLTQHGLQIARIEILENDVGTRRGAAMVNIEPAPSRWPPWNGPENICNIHRRDSAPMVSKVHVLGTYGFDRTTRTPLNFIVPRQKSCECNGLLFGIMASEDAMFKLPQYEYRDVRLECRFADLSIQLTFNVDLGTRWGVKFYKIPIEFAHIKKIIRVRKEDGGCSLVIQLQSAPKLFARVDDVSASHDNGLSLWKERDMWQRQLEITHQPHRAKNAPAELEKNRKTVDICRWTTYYLETERSHVESDMGNLVQRLNDYNVDIRNVVKFRLVEPGKPIWELFNSPKSDKSSDWFKTVHLPFAVRYQLEVCITQGLFNEYSLTAEFVAKLLTYESTSKSRDMDGARRILEGVVDRGVPYYNPMDIFIEPDIMHYWPTLQLPSQAALMRKAIVTPTGIYFKTASIELTNRVLRKYSDLTDRFLRVQFTDELNFGKLWSCQSSTQSDNLYTRVLRVLLNGIKVGDRHYKILAWSNSQFRENGAFFFCANDHVTCDDIRDWMGDLTHIRSVGKFAARMGQCFTTTRQLRGISVPKIIGIGDVHRKVDGHVWEFTDGVGKISPFFAKMIAHEHNIADTPSAFQIRMGGCKGVLVVWPDVPPSEVHIRPSQEKFKAPYNGLEIIKVSTFSQATLNRQIIPLLSCLGVEDRIFMELLEEELAEYEDAMTDASSASALLRQRIDENQISLVLADMVDTFMDGQEPFLWTVLRLWKCWILQRLKFKAAISIKKSAMLYGCVDELGVLRGHTKSTEGKANQDKDSLPQIFLQVPRQGSDPNNKNSYTVITGICIVGRNPSLHPGDIRVVEAVDMPGLRHLKNVVVFPQTGDRDIPSMCSGGDLDGDDFFVFWDKRLVPKEWNYPPMHHDAALSATEDIPYDVAINDMCAFFAQYMKNDSVGLVATAHFAWADKLGPKSAKCWLNSQGLELAKIHSMAVDYIKSGKPAIMHKSLNPKIFPHFMERKGKSRNYKTQKPVGRIYDRVNVEKFSPAYHLPFDHRILARFELTTTELLKVKEVKAQYDIAIRRLMGQYECPVSEFEIWSTFVLSKPRVGTDYKLQEQVGRDVSSLKDRFRILCGESAGGLKQTTTTFSYSGIDLAKLDRFVAAMYKVTHEEVQAALQGNGVSPFDEDGNQIEDTQGEAFSMPLISFPWLFPKELARIANGGVPYITPVLNANNANNNNNNNKQDSADQTTVREEPSADKDRAKIATLLDTKPSEEYKHIGKKGELFDAGSGEVLVDGDYVCTASGEVLQRGEILQLFNNNNNNNNNKGEVIERSHASSFDDKFPLMSMQPALIPNSLKPCECEEQYDGDEVEIAVSDEEEEEDALGAMARRLAGHKVESEEELKSGSGARVCS